LKFKPEPIEEELRELIPSFLKNTSESYIELRQAFQNNDESRMSQICHIVLGTAISYGFVQLDQVFANLQNALKASNKESVEESMKLLEDYFDYNRELFKI
jgi:HPt (histidine-containing phosphotransfer) domain-containing protein